MGILQTIKERVFPKSPAEYRAAMFTEEDRPRFQPYLDASERWEEILGNGQKFEAYLIGAQDSLAAKHLAFTKTLSDVAFNDLLNQAETSAKVQAVLHASPRLAFDVAHVYPDIIFTVERPNLGGEMADILEWMAGRYEEDIERVRGREQARLDAEAQDLAQYGMGAATNEPTDKRSKVLSRLLEHQASLQKDIELLRASKHPNGPLSAAGSHIEPVLQSLA